MDASPMIAGERGEAVSATAQLRILEHALSHDVEGSLRGIKSLAKILLQKHGAEFSKEAAELANLMADEAERVGRLLDASLDWSRCCQMAHAPAWQNTEALVREAFAVGAATRPPGGVSLEVLALPSVWGDQQALRRLFRELLANAVKFSRDQASPVVSIEAQDSDRETVVSVRDNGVGFDMAHTRQLFSLFHRLHRKQGFEGDGAGLAIARQIVTRHGGRIWTESSVGHGAVFRFVLPKPPGETAPGSRDSERCVL